MTSFLFFIDRISAWIGKAFAWCIMFMTLGVSYEVFVRYILRSPTAWAFDISYIMYGALFMMAGAYTLSRDGHVRGDVLYRLWPNRVQATVELILYFLFFFPGVFALIVAGTDYAVESWSYKEVSSFSPANIPVYQFKAIIPISAFFLLLQGIAQVIRCLLCIRDGKWPAHLHDVEEMESILQHQYASQERPAAMSPTAEPEIRR